MTKLLINNIKISINDDESVALEKARQLLRKAGYKKQSFDLSVHKRSTDARDKNNIIFVYSIIATCEQDITVNDPSIKLFTEDIIDVQFGSVENTEPPIIVGMGPAGMFCALLLAENGFCPILIDRGDNVENRTKALNEFVTSGSLDLDSNVQFGAGGAGTFSDGKLTTRINDSKCNYILSRFVEFGAPEEILTKAKPHIGTDILTKVVENILGRIEELGGKVIYRCRMDSIQSSENGIGVSTTQGDYKTNDLVLAIGHSARDTQRMLLAKGLVIEPKPFSVGVRVEHLQRDIDKALYGKYAGHPKLGVGEYNLSDTKGGRGVYTFCMCPGGEVVPATSQENGVCVNGMSRFARDGENANCAVNVSVFTEDYGNDPYKAIDYQEDLERKAFIAGGGDYFAPIQLMGDFLSDQAIHEPSRIMPTYANGKRTRVASIGNVLPSYITNRLKEGFTIFNKRIDGFAIDDAVITGVETRTSSPIRIMRNDQLTAIGNPYIYPCGEGAGYAGGIMSAAVDGIKVALEIMKKYKQK